MDRSFSDGASRRKDSCGPHPARGSAAFRTHRIALAAIAACSLSLGAPVAQAGTGAGTPGDFLRIESIERVDLSGSVNMDVEVRVEGAGTRVAGGPQAGSK
jgi:hypothetical protein